MAYLKKTVVLCDNEGGLTPVGRIKAVQDGRVMLLDTSLNIDEMQSNIKCEYQMMVLLEPEKSDGHISLNDDCIFSSYILENKSRITKKFELRGGSDIHTSIIIAIVRFCGINPRVIAIGGNCGNFKYEQFFLSKSEQYLKKKINNDIDKTEAEKPKQNNKDVEKEKIKTICQSDNEIDKKESIKIICESSKNIATDNVANQTAKMQDFDVNAKSEKDVEVVATKAKEAPKQVDKIRVAVENFNDEEVANENYYDEQYEKLLNAKQTKKYIDVFSEKQDEIFILPRMVDSKTIKKVNDIEGVIDKAMQKQKTKIYYDEISEQLNKLFESYDNENFLENLIENSHFVKVVYGKSGAYYVVGIIYNQSNPAYICYGVPSENATLPPKALNGYSEWIPLGENGQSGNGYWMMYQDAISGESVKMKKY